MKLHEWTTHENLLKSEYQTTGGNSIYVADGVKN